MPSGPASTSCGVPRRHFCPLHAGASFVFPRVAARLKALPSVSACTFVPSSPAFRCVSCSCHTYALPTPVIWVLVRHCRFVNLAMPAPLSPVFSLPLVLEPALPHTRPTLPPSTTIMHAAPLSLKHRQRRQSKKHLHWAGGHSTPAMLLRAPKELGPGQGCGAVPCSLPLLCLRLCHHGGVLVIQWHQVGLQRGDRRRGRGCERWWGRGSDCHGVHLNGSRRRDHGW